MIARITEQLFKSTLSLNTIMAAAFISGLP